MKRLFAFSILALSLVSLSGCKQVELKDGRVPQAFVARAKTAEGIYKGHVQISDGSGISQKMRQLTLNLKIDETNRVILTSSDDLIGEGCQSKIGPLLNVQLIQTKLHRVAFAIDQGLCKTPDSSDIMMVSILKMIDGKLSLSIWTRTQWTESLNAAGTAMVGQPTLMRGHFEQQ